MGYAKKCKLFIVVFTTIHCVKPDWPAEPILLTSTLLMGTLPGDISKADQEKIKSAKSYFRGNQVGEILSRSGA